mgnify:CR=1 FL=1
MPILFYDSWYTKRIVEKLEQLMPLCERLK